jgi:hypothetical protein
VAALDALRAMPPYPPISEGRHLRRPSLLGQVRAREGSPHAGLPIRESIHGSLAHTVSSAWHTLSSKGPAPAHFDLTAG